MLLGKKSGYNGPKTMKDDKTNARFWVWKWTGTQDTFMVPEEKVTGLRGLCM